MNKAAWEDVVTGLRSLTFYEIGFYASSGNLWILVLAGLLLGGSIWAANKRDQLQDYLK